MAEGFDVGLEMSGSARAFREMIDNMCHGGKIADSGHSCQRDADGLAQVIFNMLTIKGIYGREMYETWYKMSVMLRVGRGYFAGHHASLCTTRLSERALRQ